jgi:hypothetical protein
MNHTEHPISTFCSRSLVDYRSMDAPDMMKFLDKRHQIQVEDLQINEDDVSKRLDDEMLSRYWDQETEEKPLKLPPWFKEDKVIEQIIAAERRHNSSSKSSAYQSYSDDQDDTTNDKNPITTILETRPRLAQSSAFQAYKCDVRCIRKKEKRCLKSGRMMRRARKTTRAVKYTLKPVKILKTARTMSA